VRNPGSLDRLVLDHLPAALRFATRLTGDPDRAEDLVQEALLRVVRRWTTFRGEAAFRTWFFRIVINVFRDRLRASPTEGIPIDENQTDLIDRTETGPPQTAMAAELAQLIAKEVSRLPSRQREVLVLIVFEGLSAREVAVIVGISEANVHSTLSAARTRLKTRLAPYLRSVEK
jgi:RNA polymerase sigma-70 factor (ECF subfamily)